MQQTMSCNDGLVCSSNGADTARLGWRKEVKIFELDWGLGVLHSAVHRSALFSHLTPTFVWGLSSSKY